MVFYGVFKGVSMVVLWDSYGVSKVSMGLLFGFLWVSVVWDFFGMSMIYLLDF
jgi:hypothetical protein